MPPIDPLSGLSALVREQFLAARMAGTPEIATSARRKPQSHAEPPSQSPAPSLHDEAALLARVRALPLQDPDRRRSAFRLFLKDILSREFGPDLRADPEFTTLVDQVQARMEMDERLREAILTAGELLLRRAGR